MNTRGGKRAGAGRPTTIAPDSPRVHINVTLSQEVVDRITRYVDRVGKQGKFSEATEMFLRIGMGLPTGPVE